MKERRVHVGCCGFPLPKSEYARVFPVGEVQQTFYQPPRVATLERWRAMVPPEFAFTLKAWQLITHSAKSPTYRRLRVKLSPAELLACGGFQESAPVAHAWEVTRNCARALRARYVLFQCPASFEPTADNVARVRRFFDTVERDHLVFLWEPRGAWSESLISSLCAELDLVHAVDPFLGQPVTEGLIYFRLHGGKDFKHVFTDEELEWVADQIPPATEAYVMFNNLNMLADAQRFQKIIALRTPET